MKRVLIAVLALAMVSTVSAQHKRAHANRQQKQAIVRHLNLTEAQRAQAKAIKERHKTQLLELNKNEQMTVKDYRDRKEALRKAHKAELQALLSPEQKAQLQRAKAERKAQKEATMAQRMEKMKQRLQLSDAQVQQMKQQRESFRSRLEAIKHNGQLDRQQRKEQLMALKKEQKAQLDNLLTPEQKEKRKGLRQKRPSKTEAK
jgi:hypothetical protein